MTSKNDITGDSIRTKGTLSPEGRDNWDKIFDKKDKKSVDPTPIKDNKPALPNGLAKHWEETNTPKNDND